jgi:[acyl-carrier-protein] S-malonyltransferase
MRALIVAPGRGSYSRTSLGSLQNLKGRAAEIVAACDSHRSAKGLPTVTALDGEEKYRGSLHVAGEHASILTFAASLVDLSQLNTGKYEIAGVVGNSMGFYTALAATGALSLTDAITLVETMAAMQKNNVIGGQLLYPVVDADWNPDPILEAAVLKAIETIPDVHLSIRLGSYVVLGAAKESIKPLISALPEQSRGPRTFPVQLPLHSAFHTPLMAGSSETAFKLLSGLSFQQPHTPLIDGRGFVHRPYSTDIVALRDYTLGHQVVAPFDLTTALGAALSHCAPTCIVTLGPGNAMGGPTAATLVQNNWRGARTRADLDRIQNGSSPLLLSFGIAPQRKRLI